jgi:anti-sigma regulatory factor (Ser/Thr protein kinase)
VSDLVSRLENLKKDIEETKSLTISLKATAEKEEEILRSLVKEIKDLGFDPKTLKEDIEKMELEISEKISSKEKELTDIKILLNEIESNVRSHEIR